VEEQAEAEVVEGEGDDPFFSIWGYLFIV